MSEKISRRQFLKISAAAASVLALDACNIRGPQVPASQTATAAPSSPELTDTPLPPSTATSEPTKTLTPAPQPSSTQADTATPTSTELPPITEGGREILKKVVENCPGPVRYEGSYMGIKIPVTFSTDESYGNVVVKLANPAYANRLAEAAADLFFRAGYEDTHPEMSLEDFMTGWKDGTIDKVNIPANRPENSKYHAEPAEIPLTGLGLHIVFVDQNNYIWKNKLHQTEDYGNVYGVYINHSEVLLLAGIDSNHLSFARSDTDPYGPEQDLVIAFGRAFDHSCMRDQHCKWLFQSLTVIRCSNCSK